jgi:hypothetical protein
MDFKSLLGVQTLSAIVNFGIILGLFVALASSLRGNAIPRATTLFTIIAGITFTTSILPFLFFGTLFAYASAPYVLITIASSLVIGFCILRALTGSWWNEMTPKIAKFYAMGIAISLILTYVFYFIQPNNIPGY